MKRLFRFRTSCLGLVFTILSVCAEAAQYYVVVGTFAQESNARGFTNLMRGFYKEARYEYNADRNLFYVHVLKTSWKEEARNLSLYLKYERGFSDVWVLTDMAAGRDLVTQTGATGNDKGPRYSADEDHGPTTGITLTLSKEAPEGSTFETRETTGSNSSDFAWTNTADLSYISAIKNIHKLKENNVLAAGNLFTFIVEDEQGAAIPSEVKLMDFEKLKKVAGLNTGEYLAIRGTKPNQAVTLVCDVIGYSLETRIFNIDHLSRAKGFRLNEDGVWEVRFKLKKMALNDVSFMHKTTFYKDAAVLEPSSAKEAEELLALMKKNPGYKIVIHTHCNPGVRRDITLPGKTKNYFDLRDSSIKTGSDRMLTRERAETLRDYLVNHGIDKKRVDVMGWGSLDMLTGSKAADADLNERIEIELVGR